ncbi:pyridoxamine 5'-phosphate oxidase family protein [Actinoallomurus purpureus]|uniref:pyridoxamine 5'-phosphate oxidase family protein n=1 Tax=Actinoallomurus purpureus TaxID=478114 RepID=UPI0020920361|nr:pyridoxamine 5'-phosphate oxidase family protein [Actinoallomurus purpureus]MCO6007036.1 pyridoxamine 5'-phosphate oxidase family protein [Actinoallomurus purpureus]
MTTSPPYDATAGAPALSGTERTRVRRLAERAATDRRALYDVLDSGRICHLGVIVDGSVRVLPTGYGREGDTLYLHGSTGAASLRAGGEVCVTVTHLDGLVLARSVFHHSMNYRSAVIYGRPRLVTDPEEKLTGLRALVENLAPGRWDAARRPTRKELAATVVLALSLDEASVKSRQGPPADDDEDLALDVWAGVLPVREALGEPVPDPLLRPGIGYSK